jgi:hypothetical protein
MNFKGQKNEQTAFTTSFSPLSLPILLSPAPISLSSFLHLIQPQTTVLFLCQHINTRLASLAYVSKSVCSKGGEERSGEESKKAHPRVLTQDEIVLWRSFLAAQMTV